MPSVLPTVGCRGPRPVVFAGALRPTVGDTAGITNPLSRLRLWDSGWGPTTSTPPKVSLTFRRSRDIERKSNSSTLTPHATYIYIYLHKHTYTYIHIHIYINIHIHIYVYIKIDVYLRIDALRHSEHPPRVRLPLRVL